VSRRGGIVGAQAVAVAFLVLLIYMTLLRPDDPGQLRPIEAPGGGANAEPGPESGPESGPGPGLGQRSEKAERRARDRPTRSPRAGRNALADSSSTAGSATGGSAGAVPASTPALKGITPGDDQYTDSAKALLDKVATGGAAGGSIGE